MARFLRSKTARLGQTPGALVFMGEHHMDRPVIQVTTFSADDYRHRDDVPLAEVAVPAGRVTWINVCGLEDVALLDGIRDRFGLHPLVMEDILDTDSRPTLADFGDYAFITVRMLGFDSTDPGTVISEELSLIVGDGYLLSFQERLGDVFDPIRDRMREGKGRVRSAGPDYLAYRLLDTVVDHYMLVVERLGEQVEDVDEDVLDEDPDSLEKIATYKREMNFLRKAIRPSREAMIQFAKLDSDLIQDATIPFLRDLQDLVTHASESVDTYREMLSDALNTYRTAQGGKLNEIMRVLTIFAAIFIPLTFLVGIYGMNFDYLPELHYRYAYFVLLGVMAAVAGGLLWYFRRREWL